MNSNITVGHTMIYPHHGAVTIVSIDERKLSGEDTTFVTFETAMDLHIQIPLEKLDYVGVREVIDADGIAAVHGVLQEEYFEEPGNWSRRFKANTEKLSSGDVLRISEIVRDLWHREDSGSISAGERGILQKAMTALASEIALAQNSTLDEAVAHINEVLAARNSK